MATITFPPQNLTAEDAVAIDRLLRAQRAYSYRQVGTDTEASIALLDQAQRERGRIAKRHGVYHLTDARGHEILRTRRLDEVLRALSP